MSKEIGINVVFYNVAGSITKQWIELSWAEKGKPFKIRKPVLVRFCERRDGYCCEH
jgi:hypothetical protein